MSSYVSNSTLQSLDAPDLIYIPNNHSVFFTRPGIATAAQSNSRFYGYDRLTHLPQWDRENEPPSGTKFTEFAKGVFAGRLAKSRDERGEWPYAHRVTPHQFPADDRYSSDPRYAFDQRAAGYPEILNSRQWEMFIADNPALRNRKGVASGHARAASNSLPNDSLRTGSHHHPGQPPALCPKDISDKVHPHLPTRPPREVKYRTLTAYNALMEGLNSFYSQGLNAKTGHRFDDLDDDVIMAYAKAHTSLFNRRVPDTFATMKVGEQVNRGRHPSCLIPVPYLAQYYKYLDVILPLNSGYLQYLSNDILRILHVHLAAFDCGAPDNFPMRASFTDLADSRHNILCELERRGFTQRLPHVDRLRGLTSSESSSTESNPRAMLRGRPTISMAQVDEASQHGVAGKAIAHNDNSNDTSHGHARSHSQITRKLSSGETSAKKKRKGKAAVEKKIDEIDGSDQSEGMTTPSASMLPSRAESVLGLDLSHVAVDETRDTEVPPHEGTGDNSSETGSAKTQESDEDYVPESYSDLAGEAIRHALRK